ncbi:hypothetical protein C1J01_15670 [Nonomuraea aridisoli]|uniref:Uncharacterized protein n=1 Tax=Nonomuraea aridisoli TaxID=2070368 RepID=A0A2W2EXE7_9ACTN|nr:hypothetical protein C1J01_15670 [Nonomuraea aridisoli]
MLVISGGRYGSAQRSTDGVDGRSGGVEGFGDLAGHVQQGMPLQQAHGLGQGRQAILWAAFAVTRPR